MKFYKVILILFLIANYIQSQSCKSLVWINTNDSSSYIFVDNLFLGNGSIKTELESGVHEVYIKKFINRWNGKEVYDTLNIEDCNRVYNLFYQLSDDKINIENHNQIFADNDLTKNIYNNLYKEEISKSKWFKVLIGSTAVFGVFAAYFKISADGKYDEYLKSGDRDILNNVNRLDLYSGIAFGLMQINFGYLIYKFLIE
ncbi:hypothetical protein [Rosettibacter firmus]|uniref:hypothetical protein n=1 Tax=Rosettibacter firmus TaxID=3111522 RepID=UPI00336BE3FE